MMGIRLILRRVTGIFRRSKLEDRMDGEMQDHLKREIEELVGKGMSHEEARFAALKEFGNVESLKEDCRDAWGGRVLMNTIQDFRLSLRRLCRRRMQTGLLFGTFAVSVTLSLLSWSLFYTMFLQHPEFDPKGEYFVLSYASTLSGGSRGLHSPREEMEAYKEGQKVFSDFAEIGLYHSVFVQTPDGAERALAGYPSSRVLQIVGAKPLLGRLFGPEDDIHGAPGAVLISQRMWENGFGSDPGVIGKTMEVSGDAATIVGVMPAIFRFPNDQDLWLSYGFLDDSDRWPLRDALVRLKPGVTRGRAERDLQVILEQLGPERLTNEEKLIPALIPYREYYLEPKIRVSALVLFALSLVFVIVSCANAANLMLIDFLGRRVEVATSLALGIPIGSAIRNVCFQVIVIALGGALLSIALLPAAGPLLYDRIQNIGTPYWLNYHFEWQYVGVAFALAGVSAVVTVIAPTIYLLWVNPDRLIREHAYASRGTGRSQWRRLLLSGQIALLTILGVSSALLVRSSYNVGESNWGYTADRVFSGKTGTYAIRFAREYPQRGIERLVVHRRVLDEIELRPETAAAAFADNTPGYSFLQNCTYALDHEEIGEAFSMRVTEDFFYTLDVPFVMGNTFPEKNPADGPTYAVINESLAQKIWPNEDPLQRLLCVRYNWMEENESPKDVIICGVVKDFQVSGPVAQTNDFILTPFNAEKEQVAGSVHFFVRDKHGLPNVRSLSDAVHRADSRVSFYFPSTLAKTIKQSLGSMQMTTDLTTVFAMAAVLLCAIGVYSLTVAQVLQSSRDFGIRLALGSGSFELWLYFIRSHLWTTLLGVVVGLIGASQVARVFSSLLHGVDPFSASTYAFVAFIILSVSILACVPSLFRLQKINPSDSLRSL